MITTRKILINSKTIIDLDLSRLKSPYFVNNLCTYFGDRQAKLKSLKKKKRRKKYDKEINKFYRDNYSKNLDLSFFYKKSLYFSFM